MRADKTHTVHEFAATEKAVFVFAISMRVVLVNTMSWDVSKQTIIDHHLLPVQMDGSINGLVLFLVIFPLRWQHIFLNCYTCVFPVSALCKCLLVRQPVPLRICTDRRSSDVIGRTEKRCPAAASLGGPGRAGPGLQPTVTGRTTTKSGLFPSTLVTSGRQSPQTLLYLMMTSYPLCVRLRLTLSAQWQLHVEGDA